MLSTDFPSTVRIVDVEMSPRNASWPLWSPLGLHVGFHGPPLRRLERDARVWGSVTGCGRRQLIETNECLKNRRLVDVRGVMVLGVAGITEPVEITLLSGCGVRAVDGREFHHEVAFPFNWKEAAEALAARVRAVRRINPDYWYEVESLSSEERADNEAINAIAPGMM